MEEQTKAPQHHYGLQEYLSLGYLYLVALGIISDVIYYKFLGINILHYSSISDILITPSYSATTHPNASPSSGKIPPTFFMYRKAAKNC